MRVFGEDLQELTEEKHSRLLELRDARRNSGGRAQLCFTPDQPSSESTPAPINERSDDNLIASHHCHTHPFIK
ncbi:hypothetical protein INR49_006103 [Caranx melampygus]|nr:hypothetical protein INR49_006103 [Caranx melampygus]